MRIFIVSFLVLLMSSSPLFAQGKVSNPFVSGAYLYEVCKRDKDGNEAVKNGSVTCQSYIAGIVDYHNLMQSLGTSPNVDICVPKSAKLKDLQNIVARYLERNKQHDAFIAAPAVTLALFEKFPCKK